MIERLEDEGRITVIRSRKPVGVTRMEKNTAKLRALYDEGFNITEEMLEKYR